MPTNEQMIADAAKKVIYDAYISAAEMAESLAKEPTMQITLGNNALTFFAECLRETALRAGK